MANKIDREKNNEISPVTEEVEYIDNRIIGIVILVIAALILGISLFFRIMDVKKTAGFEQVEGEVVYIQKTRYYYQRKLRYKTTVSVQYYLEDTDMTYLVDGSSLLLDFAKKGDSVIVCYEKYDPFNSYIAEKDWLTGGYYHAGKGYNGALVVAALIGLLGLAFIKDAPTPEQDMPDSQ